MAETDDLPCHLLDVVHCILCHSPVDQLNPYSHECSSALQIMDGTDQEDVTMTPEAAHSTISNKDPGAEHSTISNKDPSASLSTISNKDPGASLSTISNKDPSASLSTISNKDPSASLSTISNKDPSASLATISNMDPGAPLANMDPETTVSTMDPIQPDEMGVIAVNVIDMDQGGEDLVKKYICDVCGIGLSNLQNLRRHLYIHSDEKNFKCLHCGEKFKWASGLEYHIDTKHSNKQYVCVICTKQFKNKITLRNHKNKPDACANNVARPKNLTCVKCDKKLSTVGNYKRHVAKCKVEDNNNEKTNEDAQLNDENDVQLNDQNDVDLDDKNE